MQQITFQDAQPTEADAAMVREWRNDPTTLKFSFHTEKKTWPSFLHEFCEQYFPGGRLAPLFALHKGERIGFLRFRPYRLAGEEGEEAVEVNVNLAPQFRGLGLGAEVIRRATELLMERGFTVAVAEIKRDNTPSIRAFERAGYLFYDATVREVEGVGAVPIYRLTKEKERELPEAPSFRSGGVFIVAEAGSNWRMGNPKKDLEMAQALIEVAAEAGADAVKFQTFRAETVYVPNAGDSDYLSQAGIKESIVDIFKDLAMPYEMLPRLAEHCKNCDIEFMSTPFSIKDAEAVDPFVSIHKNASYEISHIYLLKFFAGSGKPLVLSTGGATYGEIEWAVALFFENGGDQLCLMQCTAKYPAPPHTLNLRVIPQLIARFGLPVGLSDHSREPVTAPVAGVSLGASVIEKHFTVDNTLPGPDHAYSILPDELKAMVQAVRETEQALGSAEKVVLDEERELREYAHRAIQTTREIKKGEVLMEGENIEILRPGRQKAGLHPRFITDIVGKRARRDIPLGDGVQEGDYE